MKRFEEHSVENSARGIMFGVLFAVFLWFVIAAVIVGLSGCSTPEQPMTPPWQPPWGAPRGGNPFEAGDSVAAATAEETYGVVSVRIAPTPCDPSGGSPYVVPAGRPIAGEPFRVLWTTRPTAPFPTAPTVLLVSLAPMAPGSLSWWGAPSCWLMVQPQFVMTPASGTILTQDGGRVHLDWTPGAGLIGASFFCQLAVNDNRNQAGWTLSPMLELHVGNR